MVTISAKVGKIETKWCLITLALLFFWQRPYELIPAIHRHGLAALEICMAAFPSHPECLL
jgi:RsiW-degrading membrane proteinase PrsW (M82 family)